MTFSNWRKNLRLPALDYRLALVAVVLYFTLAFNWVLLRHFYAILTKMQDYDPLFAATAPLVVIFALTLVFVPFSFRYIFKPAMVFFIVTAAIVNYAMQHYGIVFDKAMFTNFADTYPAEALSYVSGNSVFWVVATGILPAAILIAMPIKYPRSVFVGLGQRLVILTLVLACTGLLGAGYYKNYASIGRNNKILGKEAMPFNYVVAGIQYGKMQYRAHFIPFQTIGEDAKHHPAAGKPNLVFLVIGETARAENVELDGYKRDTSPFTRTIPGLVSFEHVSSCGTATAISVPCMFSDMTRANFDGTYASKRENLLDVVAKTGVSVFWKENDGGCKGVCDRIPNIELSSDMYPDLCNGHTCLDAAMLQDIDPEMAKMKPGDKLMVFHIIGSHGPTYYQRYPENFRTFTPDCPRSDIENCSHQELVNSYDNSLRYTDYVISQLIAKLQSLSNNYNPSLLYVSDHGESLGENGLYLHGAPYMLAPSQQTHVPMFMWMAKQTEQSKNIDPACVGKTAKDDTYSQDNLFSTVLGLLDISTSLYQTNQDILAKCEKPGTRTAANSSTLPVMQ
ncbi:phosphoethanolamine transferase [Thalassospira profundimaris]|uniref:phosphoethanolamine transferase n=1 Tax=Thalassospira profundimaris TaxID=502049 RepID=UPI000DEDDA72|nr:phosphoethanolamine--lipid A transferase [Thalassospira profundimaris]